MANGQGGPNRGQGRPKGSVGTNTLRAREQRKLLQELLAKRFTPMINAQIDAAIGMNVMMVRKLEQDIKTKKWKRTGKWIRVQEPEQIGELLNGNKEGNDYYQIWTLPPNVPAAKALLDKAVGTPRDADAPEEKTPLLVLIKQLNVAKLEQLGKGEVTKVISDAAQ